MLELAPVWVWLGSALKPTDPRPAGGTKLVRRLQATAGCEFVDAPDGGDDVLAHGTAVASVLDNLEVAARSRLLQAKEHGALRTEHHTNSHTSNVKRAIIIIAWHYILRAVS